MTPDETKLFNEMKKLVNTANQRIRNIEREIGKTPILGVRELKEKLESLPMEQWTAGGRPALRKNLSETQMIAEINALKDFLEDKQYSTLTGIKQAKKQAEIWIGKPILWSNLDKWYTAKQITAWVKETYGSDFWKDFAPEVHNYNKNTWVNMLDVHRDSEINDLEVRDHLKFLYEYCKKDNKFLY